MRKNLSSLMASLSLCAALALPLVSFAQELKEQKEQKTALHHYKLVDIGTFGGPNSSYVGPPPAVRLLNNSGVAVGGSDTSTPDPGSCWNYDCYLSYGFKWRDGAVHKLDALPGFNSSFTFWVSDSGLVAGLSENGIDPLTGNPAQEAVLWGKDGALTDLGTLGGNESEANAVNNRSEVAGGALNAIPDDPYAGIFFLPGGTQVHAFRWTRSHGMQDLGTLGGNDSTALFINEQGQIAGESFTETTLNASTGTPTLAPFFWEDGKMLNLGTLGGSYGEAWALNNRGQVVGYSDLEGDQTLHPFLWSKSEGMKDISTPALGGVYGHADYINDEGDVVGFAVTADFQGRAFLWRQGVMTNLGTLGTDPASESYGVNSRGQVVGNTFNDCCDLRAFLWEQGGPMVDLNTLIPANPDLELDHALYINDRGEIAGQGTFSNGDIHTFILIPCDQNHPDVEGCDYAPVGAVTEAPVLSAQVAKTTPAASATTFSPTEMTTRLRSLMAGRNRRFGIPQTSPK
jgi:probable HAF family extracellular repeat protein